MLNAYEKQLILDNPNVNIPVLAKLIGCSSASAASYRVKWPTAKWYYKAKGLPFTSKSAEGVYKVNYRGTAIVSTAHFSKAMGCVDRLIECIEGGEFGRIQYDKSEYEKRNLKPRVERTLNFKRVNDGEFVLPANYQIAKKSDFKR